MQQVLEQTIARTRREARRLTLYYAVAWVVVALLAITTALVLLDQYLRIEHPLGRLFFSACWVAGWIWALRHFLWSWFTHRADDVAIAQRIQERFPELEDRLATAVEFLAQNEDDSRAGSPALRRAVVVQASSQLEDLDTDSVLDRRPTWRALWTACGALGVALILGLIFSASTSIGVARLAAPWSENAWPRRHVLELEDPPQRLAEGSDFEVEVTDRNEVLPEVVRIQYRFADDSSRISEEEMNISGNKAIATRVNVRRGFAYRVTGGDDDTMPWQEVQVLKPPRVESVEVTLTPPTYTGWASTTTTGQIRALVGTQLAMVATASKPLRQATLRFEDGTGVAAKIGPGGRSFSVASTAEQPVMVDESGAYWFELVDDEEMANGGENRWRIEAIVDEPPTVTVEEPRQDVFVTPAAKIPVRVTIKDQLAIRDAAIVYLRSDASADGARRRVLIEPRPQPVVAEEANGQPTGLDGGGQLERMDDLWELAKLDPSLTPGSLVTFHVEASDFVPQAGRSQPELRIHVISKEALEDRLASRYAKIAADLAEAVRQQWQARQKVRDVEIQLDVVGELPNDDLNVVRQVDMQQRDIRRSLVDDRQSVQAEIDSVLDEIENNEIDNPEVQQRLEGLRELLEQLDADQLPQVQQQLTAAIKEAQTAAQQKPRATDPAEADAPQVPGEATDDAKPDAADANPDPQQQPEEREAHPAEAPLNQAGQGQEEIIAKLETALDDLQRWARYRGFQRDLAEILRDQQDLKKAVQEKGQSLLGREAQNLKPEDADDLEAFAQRQAAMGQRLDNLVQRMARAAEDLQASDPAAAEPLADAAEHGRQASPSGDMRQAAENIRQNQVARAENQQQQVADKIGEMLDMLSSRSEDNLARRVKKLRKAEKDLATLRERQEGLRKAMEQAAAEEDEQQRKRELQRLAREQEKVQEEIGRLLRRLERLGAQRAGSKLSQAGSSAGKASNAGRAGQGDQAGESAAQAERDLAEAQQALEKERRQAEIDLAQQILARIEDDFNQIHELQTKHAKEARDMEAVRLAKGTLTRGQKSSVAALSREQDTLAKTTRELTKDLAGAETFAKALERIAAAMERAAARLAKIDTGKRTQAEQQAALRRLELLRDALKKGEDEGEEPPEGGSQQGGEGGGQQGGQGGIRSIAEIRLLRLMQGELNERSRELQEEIGDGRPNREQARRMLELAEEQGELAELTFRLMEEEDAAPEDTLEEPGEVDAEDDAADDDVEIDVDAEDLDADAAEERAVGADERARS
ncbi:MAG: hypothetical protein DWQ42_00625 [Planctomycetota bacterium]|nr:MAG: hypothetical protein DWQ42_00625 [Planctomycetota bacterium]REK40694.1 MAG: hypothetical protein DWQ46_15765 [Planctomycetota bacterium]